MDNSTQKTEQSPERFDTWENFSKRMLGLQQTYSGLPMDSIYSAFMGAGGRSWLLNWPDIQNRRVKRINTLPGGYNKEQVENMVAHPDENEQGIRGVSAALASTTKTYDNILQVRQDILTYDWYIYPAYKTGELDKEQMFREYALAQKVAEEMNIKAKAHEIVGLCAEYGKVFYTTRVSVDKTHNKVNYAFIQQLPTDWCKIVGFNNGPGKYTVAFNLMYFLQPGNTWQQFGDLFKPYMSDFFSAVDIDKRAQITAPLDSVGGPKKYVYSAAINIKRMKQLADEGAPGAPEWAAIGQQYYYWVTLPADKAGVFEINDRTVNVVPDTTGLMVSMTQIPNFENAQLEVVLSPLVSILTGELETNDPKTTPNNDTVRVSPTVRETFEALWYRMLNANNTSGIGLYLAPAKNLKLQTLSDTVSNTDITTTALSDQIMKAGLGALIPSTSDPKVGLAQISAKIQANYARPVYWSFERLMNSIFDRLRFKGTWRFKMFGDIFSSETEREAARTGMTLGIAPDAMRYDALMGHTMLDDMAISEFVEKSGLANKRKPLITSYSAKQSDSGLPPQVAHDMNPGGRPAEEGSENSQKTEKTTIEAVEIQEDNQ